MAAALRAAIDRRKYKGLRLQSVCDLVAIVRRRIDAADKDAHRRHDHVARSHGDPGAVEIVAVAAVHDPDTGVAEEDGGGCRSGDQHQNAPITVAREAITERAPAAVTVARSLPIFLPPTR